MVNDKLKRKDQSVIIDGHEVKLTVTYCVPNVDSNTNTFSEFIGGRYDTSKDDAISMVISSANAFADQMRSSYPEISVWDDSGNSY